MYACRVWDPLKYLGWWLSAAFIIQDRWGIYSCLAEVIMCDPSGLSSGTPDALHRRSQQECGCALMESWTVCRENLPESFLSEGETAETNKRPPTITWRDLDAFLSGPSYHRCSSILEGLCHSIKSVNKAHRTALNKTTSKVTVPHFTVQYAINTQVWLIVLYFLTITFLRFHKYSWK